MSFNMVPEDVVTPTRGYAAVSINNAKSTSRRVLLEWDQSQVVLVRVSVTTLIRHSNKVGYNIPTHLASFILKIYSLILPSPSSSRIIITNQVNEEIYKSITLRITRSILGTRCKSCHNMISKINR